MYFRSTSFSLTRNECIALDKIKHITGLDKTTIMRQLLKAYADGLSVPGLPMIDRLQLDEVELPPAIRARYDE